MGSGRQFEKRRFIRYRARDKVFAALGEKFSRVGKVKDISVGGLAFEYVGEPESSNDLSRIDIFVTSNGFHLSRIPCKKIYEIPSPNSFEQYTPTKNMYVSRCGVEFGKLEDNQLSQLKYLLDNYASRTVFRTWTANLLAQKAKAGVLLLRVRIRYIKGKGTFMKTENLCSY